MLHFLLMVSFKTGRSITSSKYVCLHSYIFQASQPEKHLNVYPHLLKEIVFPYGIGLEKIFQKKRIRIPAFIVDEILVKADKEDVSP